MRPLEALASVLTAAAFHAQIDGTIIESNAAFTQLMRCVPGDDWRLHVAPEDRALVDDFWSSVAQKPADLHEPIAFRLHGVEDRFELRAQVVTDDAGEVQGAVGLIVIEPSTATRRWSTDNTTGLPETEAARSRIDELISQHRSFATAVVLLDAEDADDEVVRKEAARQLLTTIRPTDLLTSSADGRFVLCAPGIETQAAAVAMAERMLEALGRSELSSRIGLAIPDHAAGSATLLREAEAGAYASPPDSFGFAPSE